MFFFDVLSVNRLHLAKERWTNISHPGFWGTPEQGCGGWLGRNDAQQRQVDKDHNAHEGLKALTHHHFGKEDTALGPYHLSPKMLARCRMCRIPLCRCVGIAY